MSFSLTRTEQLNGNGTSLNSTRSYTNTGNPRVSESIPDSSVALHVTHAVDVSELDLIALYANGALTVTPMDAANAPVGSAITLASNKCFVWGNDDGTANPFSDDIAYWHVTNASGAAVTLIIEALVDATP